MAVSPPKPYCHTFVSYFPVFQMSAIPHVFWPSFLKLGCVTNFDMLFLLIHFFGYIIKFMATSHLVTVGYSRNKTNSSFMG